MNNHGFRALGRDCCGFDFSGNARNMSRHVRLSIAANQPVERQTPGRTGQWGEYEFTSDPCDRCDYWAVFESIPCRMSALCEQGHAVFVTAEPPSIRNYNPEFLAQFSAVITFRDDIDHPNVIRSHPLLPWWIGTRGGHVKLHVLRDYDDFKRISVWEKQKAISVVCSGKTLTENHRIRLEFVRVIASRLGGLIDAFGHGFRPIEDKWDAIVPYRYHIAIENSAYRDYWTEKVADTYIGGALPIYWGCPNLGDYFPAKSFRTLPLHDTEAALAQIEGLLAGDDYERSLPDIRRARELVLDHYNFFPELTRILSNLPPRSPTRFILEPERFPAVPRIQRVRSAIGRAVRRVLKG